MTKLTWTGVTEALSLGQMAPSVSQSELEPVTSPAIVPFPKWQRARDRACAAVLAGESRLLLTGSAGTGKSALLREIARILRYAGWQVTIRIAALQVDGEQTVSTCLRPHRRARARVLDQSVLLIDEADRLSDPELEQLETERSGAVVLAGRDRIASRWEAGARISLAALTPAEARAYIAQWMSIAGQDLSHFEPCAIERVADLGSGLPRLLSSLLSGAMWIAAASGTETVTRQHVEDAAALRACFLEDEGDSPSDAECRPYLPPAAQHDLEQAKTEFVPNKTSARTEASVDVGQIQDAATLQEAALPSRRGMLLPTLAACVAVAAGGGAAVRTWPEQTMHAAQFVRAIVVRHISPAKELEAVASTEPSRAVALPTAKEQPQPEPIVEAVQLRTESSAPPGPEAAATAGSPRPAASLTLDDPVPGPTIVSATLQPPSPKIGTAAPEPMSLHAALSVERHWTGPVGGADSEQIAASPEQRQAAPIEVAGGGPLASAASPADAPSAVARSQSEESSFVPPQPQFPSPAPPHSAPPVHAETPSGLTPEPQAAAVSPPAAVLVTAKVSPAGVVALLARGDALIAIGDIATARLVYQRAAALGSGLAATATGKTYDPRFLRQIGALGVVANPEAAAVWYRKAVVLGDGDAVPFLSGLEAKTGR
jgi:hypothetical protein